MSISTCALREEGDFHFAPDARPPKNFYPRPPRGGRPAAESLAALTDVFLSTPSARRATIPRPHLLCWHHDFYPRPPRGGRLTVRSIAPGRSQFLSTPSARRATAALALPRRLVRVFLSTPSARRATARATSTQHPQVHFYPRPPRGGRPAQSLRRRRPSRISIHALREEGDAGPAFPRCRPAISIHALREEGDATVFASSAVKTYFYPRPPRGGRRRGVRPAHHHHQ